MTLYLVESGPIFGWRIGWHPKYSFITLNIPQLLEREKLADSRMARRIQEYMAED